jgi:hypothetical protein
MSAELLEKYATSAATTAQAHHIAAQLTKAPRPAAAYGNRKEQSSPPQGWYGRVLLYGEYIMLQLQKPDVVLHSPCG